MGSINTDFAVWIRVVCGGLGFGLRVEFGWFSAWWLGFWGFAEFTFGWCGGCLLLSLCGIVFLPAGCFGFEVVFGFTVILVLVWGWYNIAGIGVLNLVVLGGLLGGVVVLVFAGFGGFWVLFVGLGVRLVIWLGLPFSSAF